MEDRSDLDRNLGPGELRPWVEVRHPDGAIRTLELEGDVRRVGRETGWTDLDLRPDERRWISRRHCRIERRGSGWAVVDEGSRNGTFVADGPARAEVEGLRPQEHRLIRHFVARNRDAGGAALCVHEELITAVWGEEPHAPHTREDLARLVYDLRRKLEADPARPRLLQTVRGFGYRLITVPAARGSGD